MTKYSIALVLAFGGFGGLQYRELNRQKAQMQEMQEQLSRLANRAAADEQRPPELPSMQHLLARMALTTAVPAAAAPNSQGAEKAAGKEAAPAAPAKSITRAEIEAHIQSAFQQQTNDPAWAPQAVKHLREGVAAILPDSSQVRSLDCRTSLCQLELTRMDEKQYQEVMAQATRNPSFWSGGSMGSKQESVEDGKLDVVLYLAREGQPLPMPDGNAAL
jgi:hypothetical protein